MPLRDVLGHNRLIALLKRSVAGASLPPSLLFAGPAGVGKRKTALGLAQALNCLSPHDGDACGSCAACTRIARGVHPDVAILEPEEVRDARRYFENLATTIDGGSYDGWKVDD